MNEQPPIARATPAMSAWEEEEHVKRLHDLCHPSNQPDGGRDDLRRGFAAQRLQRERELDLRRRVIDFTHWTHTAHDRSIADIAISLHLAPRTLCKWFADFHANLPTPLPLGRPAIRSSRDDRQAVLALLSELGPATGLPTLQDCFPLMPRAELDNLLRRYRAVWQKRHHYAPHFLEWTTPGAVWAIDFSEAPAPIDGQFKNLLAVRDLASHQQLLWTPVADMTADAAIRGLSSLFAIHGAPLVLKSDNGPAFVAEQTRAFLESRNVFCLFSPPHTPRYNGSIEAGIGSLKSRTERHAQRHGHPGYWTTDDVAFAQLEANATARPRGPRGPTPDDLWAQSSPITLPQRTTFTITVERHRADVQAREGESKYGPRTDAKERLMDRDAIRRALGEHDLLFFSRRRLPLPFSDANTAEIR